ncbi:MAG: hypothetical protein ABS85_03160 [Sphingobacteriales bacterium SCN 48-20]|uniref:porin family protein n=1 Tax=Terrimonas ferruginea TaxID=249 RepID=UPI00086ED75A|nr:porin family protein [Terrimonas ferruginea]MBN8785303.1 PorT family protein [Terrimonas ferruginea]ODT94538.1 MAG: hypothetical protein ABS85_03160 [Sphingobacteriales bacterium SCN 48-20]
MKTMLLPVLLLLSLFTSAQKLPLTFGVNAGANLSNGTETVSYLDGTKENKWGYQFGATVHYQVVGGFYLESGLLLTAKGVRHRDAEQWIGGLYAVTYWERTTNLVYLQLPVKIGYEIPVAKNWTVHVNGGGYVAYGIAGNIVRKETTVSEADIPDRKIATFSFGDHRYGYDRNDYGLTAGAGVQYRKFILLFNYEAGIPNIGSIKEEGTWDERTFRNKNMGLTVGYRF